MKIILLSFSLILTSIAVMAKEIPEEKLPVQVQQAFRQAHPNARDVEVEEPAKLSSMMPRFGRGDTIAM